MKKLIVLAAVALFGTQVAKAQFSKGDVILGGNLTVSTSTDKVKGSDAKTTDNKFGINPKVGVALNPNWVIGVFADTKFGSAKEDKAAKVKTFEITPGVFVRNYHMIGQSKFAFFAEANAGYHLANVKHDDDKFATVNGFKVNVLPGITYFVTKHFMLEGAFGGVSYGYDQTKLEAGGAKLNSSKFDFNFPKEFSLGVNWIF